MNFIPNPKTAPITNASIATILREPMRTSFGAFHIAVSNLFEEWAHCREWLLPALQNNLDTRTEDDLVRDVVNRNATLIVGQQSAMLVEPCGFTNKRAVVFSYCGGNLDEIAEARATVYPMLKAAGCEIALIQGRRGWLRAFPEYKELFSTFAMVM